MTVCQEQCTDQVKKIVRILLALQRSGYHGSLTIDFNHGVMQPQRLRKIEIVDALRR